MLFVKLLIALAICLQLPVIALAHPGGTDYSGGHTDHDTGEYHYHHGHPAHDHYDMDGDGIPNCPYDSDFQPNYATIKKDSPSDGEGSLSPFDIELEKELEKLRKEMQNSAQSSTKPSVTTSKSLWDKMPTWLQTIICVVCFYGIWAVPGWISMGWKKLFKKKK